MLPDLEIQRLMDVMPATGRMLTKIVKQRDPSQVMDVPFPWPWMPHRPIAINFDLWEQLSQPERDLLILRATSWTTGVQWFRPRLEQGIALVGLVGAGVQLVQADPVGTVAAAGLSAIALRQIWQNNRSTARELEADEAAVRVAQRRGYGETEAARYLLQAIARVANLEKRTSLSFVELLRSQNLQAIAGLTTETVPETIRRDR
jgi:hypothetical protein